jgi:hypothetical protein
MVWKQELHKIVHFSLIFIGKEWMVRVLLVYQIVDLIRLTVFARMLIVLPFILII